MLPHGPLCAIPSCPKQRRAGANRREGLCPAHAARLRKGRSLFRLRLPNRYVAPIKERIRARSVVDEAGCWIFQGRRTAEGYGYISRDGRLGSAHRVAYEAWFGSIPEGFQVDHLCGNPSCVCPNHLEAVTQRENWERSNSPTRVNRDRTHCIRGHEFTPENTYRRSSGGRSCRICGADSQRRYRERKRAA